MQWKREWTGRWSDDGKRVFICVFAGYEERMRGGGKCWQAETRRWWVPEVYVHPRITFTRRVPWWFPSLSKQRQGGNERRTTRGFFLSFHLFFLLSFFFFFAFQNHIKTPWHVSAHLTRLSLFFVFFKLTSFFSPFCFTFFATAVKSQLINKKRLSFFFSSLFVSYIFLSSIASFDLMNTISIPFSNSRSGISLLYSCLSVSVPQHLQKGDGRWKDKIWKKKWCLVNTSSLSSRGRKEETSEDLSPCFLPMSLRRKERADVQGIAKLCCLFLTQRKKTKQEGTEESKGKGRMFGWRCELGRSALSQDPFFSLS